MVKKDWELDDTSFKAGTIFGLQMAQSSIMDNAKNQMFSVYNFAGKMEKVIQDKIDNLVGVERVDVNNG